MYVAESARASNASVVALLVLDQCRRVADYDPCDPRTLAAKHFIRRACSSTQAGLVAVAGFAGQGGEDSGPADSQRHAALASLRQQQADTGIQVALIAGRLHGDSVERKILAEKAICVPWAARNCHWSLPSTFTRE